jgi:bile acid:Na+ symporter, BASS family
MSLEALVQGFLPPALALMMLGLGASLSLDEFKRTLEAPRALIAGICGQLLVLPLSAFLIAWLFALPPEHAVGLVIIACCPGGIASNVVSFAVKGDVALSITLTVISTVATLFSLPLLVAAGLAAFAPSTTVVGRLPYLQTVGNLAVLILLPVLCGISLKQVLPHYALRIERFAERSAFPFLCLVMLIVMMSQWEVLSRHLLGVALPVLLFCCVMCLAGLFLSLTAGLGLRQRKAVIIEVALQNTTLALWLCLSYLEQPAFVLVPGTYGVVMFLAAGIFVRLARTR